MLASVFCQVLALVFPSYVFVFMLDLCPNKPRVYNLSVISGFLTVSVDLPSLLIFWDIPAATSFA